MSDDRTRYVVKVPFKTLEEGALTATDEIELLADTVICNDRELIFYLNGVVNMAFNNNGGWQMYYPLVD